MALKEAQSELRKHGITLKKTGYGNEHRVAYKGKGQEASAYYTDDLEDAKGTGHKMAEKLRMAGDGSYDPHYKDSHKNK